MHPARRSLVGITEGVELFVHSDNLKHLTPGVGMVLHQDSPTCIRMTAAWPLVLAAEWRGGWTVSPYEATFADCKDAFQGPVCLLTRITIFSKTLGAWHAMVLYMGYENRNLLEALFLPCGVTVSHVSTVRDGSGFGGGRRDVSTVIAPLASQLGVRFVVSDAGRLGWKVDLALERVACIEPRWSGLIETAYRLGVSKAWETPLDR